MVVLLHGVGSNEEDLFGLADGFGTDATVVSVRAPLVLGPGSFGWFPVRFTPQGPVADAVQAEASRVQVLSFVSWAIEAYGADPQRVVLVGFSQGAIMAASAVLTAPRILAGAVLMSGRILAEAAAQAVPGPDLAQAQVLVVHGTQDERLPLFHGQASRDTLESLGVKPDYREFPMGHTITPASLEVVVDWVRIRTRS